MPVILKLDPGMPEKLMMLLKESVGPASLGRD